MERPDLHKIVILNSKGGCGKTTLSTTLAAALAARGSPPTLFDCDPQGFAMTWLDKRPKDLPRIHGVAAYGDTAMAGPLREHMPGDSHIAIIDLPAAIPHRDLYDFTYMADSVLIPILPSAIDIYSASRLVAELLLDAQLDRREGKLAIVANRVRRATKSYRQLQRFLASLQIPLLATLRDTQNFVYAASCGIGITELPRYLVQAELAPIEAIVTWLDRRRDLPADGQAADEPAAKSEETRYQATAYPVSVP